MSDDQQVNGPESERPFGMPTQRTPVVFDPAAGGLRIGEHVRRVEDPSEPSQVYGAYLSLLYAVRGAKPGNQLPLRAADLEALLLLVGDDPETIEQRLVGLMGCSAEEARVLGGILLRHRKTTAALGVAAGLLLGGSLANGLGGPDAATPDAELVTAVSAESAPEPSGGTVLSGVTSPGGTTVVLAPPAAGGTTATPAAPVTGGGSSTTGGDATAVTGPAVTPRSAPASAPVVVAAPPAAPTPPPPAAAAPATSPEVTPGPPVATEPADRDLPPTPGRPIGGTVGGEDGDGSSFEQPAPTQTPTQTPAAPVDGSEPPASNADAAGSSAAPNRGGNG